MDSDQMPSPDEFSTNYDIIAEAEQVLRKSVIPFHRYQRNEQNLREKAFQWWNQALTLPRFVAYLGFVMTLITGNLPWFGFWLGVRLLIAVWLYYLYLEHLSATKMTSQTYQRQLRQRILTITAYLVFASAVVSVNNLLPQSLLLLITSFIAPTVGLFFGATIERHQQWLSEIELRYAEHTGTQPEYPETSSGVIA